MADSRAATSNFVQSTPPQLRLVAGVAVAALVGVALVMARSPGKPTTTPANRPGPSRRLAAARALSPAVPRPAARPPGPGQAPALVARPRYLQPAPDITIGQASPHRYRGRCVYCHQVLPPKGLPTLALLAPASPLPAVPPLRAPAAVAPRPLVSPPAPAAQPPCPSTAGTSGGAGAAIRSPQGQAPSPNAQGAARAPAPVGRGGTPAPRIEMLPFQEAHWQGLELITLTPALARFLKIPSSTKGVAVDEVTMPADTQGFAAGDIITSVGGQPTTTLEAFVAAADVVRERPAIEIELLRKNQPMRLKLASFGPRLGNANGETAPMIASGARMPHAYQGPCTQCHHIGTGANLAADLGDPLTTEAPAIAGGQRAPHGNRGKCSTCHVIR